MKPGTADSTMSASRVNAWSSSAFARSARLGVTRALCARRSSGSSRRSATMTSKAGSFARSRAIGEPTRPAPRTVTFMKWS